MSVVPETMPSAWPVTMQRSIEFNRPTHSSVMFGTFAVGQWK